MMRLSWMIGCLTLVVCGLPRAEAGEWSVSTPAAEGLDVARLERLVATLEAGREYPDLHSLLVVRNGRLVLEAYFDGWSADRLHTLQSVSKSFTSALVGIAIDRGAIEGVEETVVDFFPEWLPSPSGEATGETLRHLDERKRAITIEDLLTMRSGTDYHERGADSPHSQLNRRARGWDRFYLDRPMIADPGSTFRYDSGGVILLSSLLERRTGLHADAFAERYLFGPLGITEVDWYRNREGHPHTGGGLELQPRDMAKFGQLYLQGGLWEGRQVVSAGWVALSTRSHVERSRGHNIGYGYLWWIHEPDPDGEGVEPIYAAQGFRGQYIFVVPEHAMVVVVTGGTSSFADEIRPIDMLYREILPSVRR